MRIALFLFCILSVAPSFASDPPAKTIDQLLADLATQRAAKEAAIKAETDTINAIKALLASDAAKAAAAGITIGPPVPVDPLVSSIQSAYKADPSVGKAGDARLLAGVYRTIASQMDSIGTSDTLLSTINSMTKAELAGRLGTITPLIGKDFLKKYPLGSVILTAEQKAAIGGTLKQYADILDGLTKQ